MIGYRKKRSTDIAATYFVDNIRKNIDIGKLVGAIFIDLTKAFDTVSHSVLLSKLSVYGIKGVELEWFTNYLFGRKQQVVTEYTKSESEFISCGVPQGSILGPVLFLLYFNDFSKTLFKSEVLMFAGDTVVFYAGKSAEEIESVLNSELENIFRYFIKNDLIVNLRKGKTEALLFGTRRRLNMLHGQSALKFGTFEINSTNNYKYLASVIDGSLTLSENFNCSFKKASSRLRLLNALRPNLDDKTSTLINTTMVTLCSCSTA